MLSLFLGTTCPAAHLSTQATTDALPVRRKDQGSIRYGSGESHLVSRAAISIQKVEREASAKAKAIDGPNSTPRLAAGPAKRTPAAASEQQVQEVCRALRSLHLLLRAERLYDKNHPRRLDSLDGAYDALKNTAEILGGIEIRIERGG